MPAVEDVLADLASHPPSDPTPVGEIRGRARRRTRRRRTLTGLAVVVVLVGVGIGVGAAVTSDSDSGEDVMASGGTTTSAEEPGPATTEPSSTASVPVATEEPTMTLVPASGYEDGTVVEMALDEPATGPALVAQCAAEAEALGDGSLGVLPFCTDPIEMPAEALQPFTLTRTIETPDGTVDCAEAVGRCTLGVRVGGSASADDRFAPLAFRADLPAVVAPVAVVDGDEGVVGDGDALLVTLTGVATGDVVHVSQCIPAILPDAGEGDWQCSYARDRTITVQDGPETQLTFTAFHDVFVNTADPGGWDPGWAPCEPCQLQIRLEGRAAPIASLPMAMAPTDDPIRPAVALDPPGPHAPGEVVTVRATGLQRGDTADIAWCIGVPPQGGGDSPCSFPGEGGAVEVVVADDGTAVATGFALPTVLGVQGGDCRAAPGECAVGLHALDSFAVLAIAPLDLSG